MAGYLKVKNWEEFQHYKDRDPPWIKLHRNLLRDYEFSCLQDASKLQLMLIWLLASQLENKIPNDPKWIALQIGVSEPVNLKPLIDMGYLIMMQDASKTLAECKQVAMLETETETETETELDAQASPVAKTKRGSRLPEDWQPSDDLQMWARKERSDLSLTQTIDSFVDYWKAKTGAQATKLDWDATFRNWIRNAKPGNARNSNQPRETPVQRSERIEREQFAKVGIEY